jgi:hypothetical protein
MSEFTELKKECEEEGLIIKEVPRESLKDFAGMNEYVAPIFGYPRVPPKTILIDKSLPSKTKLRTLKHEIVERRLMAKGMKYWPAHVVSLRAERK